MSVQPQPSKFPGRCKRCGGWIRRSQPCLMAPFRHPGCAAWQPGELEALEARIRGVTPVPAAPGPSPRDGAVPVLVRAPWVVRIDPAEINERIAALALDLLRIDRQHDGYVRFNPDHASRCQQICVQRRQVVEDEIAELRTALALRVIQEETA